MRLAMVSHRFSRNDGQGRVNYEVVRCALDAGHDVTVVATHCADELANHPRAQFIRIADGGLPTELLRNLVFATKSAQWLKQHRASFDLVQANGFVTWEPCDVVAAHFIHTAWAKNEWYPFRSVSPYSLYQRLYTALNSRWEKSAFTRAKRVIAVSRLLGPDLIALGVEPSRIVVIPNGVDTEQFQPGPSDRAFFSLPESRPLAFFIGDIRTPRKNLDTILQALRSVPELHLAVAGSAEGSPYPQMALDLGIGERVTFLGKVSEVPKLMRSVDFFVFPSRYEAHPLVLLEAMAAGLPSIVSNTFGASDFLNGGGIILEDANDVDELVRSMKRLIQDPNLRQQMGRLGREAAVNMSWNRMAHRYLDLYESLIHANHP